MQKTRKAVLAIATVSLLSSAVIASPASAEWKRAGYDTTNMDDICVVYNEIIDGHYTNKTKEVPVKPWDIVWKAESYELAYPHAGYDRLYLEGNAQEITRYNNLFPQWETRFADYFWELAAPYTIYERQQTKIPGRGWTWDYGENEYIDSTLFVPTTRLADVVADFQPYAIGPFNYDGTYVSDEVMEMFRTFGVADHSFIFDPVTKYITAGFFMPENLSRLDDHGEYVLSDEEIANYVASIQSKFLTGPSLRGDDPRKDVAAEYLLHKDEWTRWDADSLRYGGGKVSWTKPTYEMKEPYKMFQYMIINGVTFDGHADLPIIYRYTNGLASPNVEWKYAFSEAAAPYRVIEFKYIDGKLAVDENGYPIYRAPTGEYAHIYTKSTDTKLQLWLKDDVADVMVWEADRTDNDKGGFDSYMGGANRVVR